MIYRTTIECLTSRKLQQIGNLHDTLDWNGLVGTQSVTPCAILLV